MGLVVAVSGGRVPIPLHWRCVFFFCFFFGIWEASHEYTVCFLSSKRIGHWVKISQSSPAWGSSEPLCPSPAQSGSSRWIASREARDVNGDVKATDVICELESCQYSWEVDSNYLDTSRHSHMLHVWNIYQHLPEQNHPDVGKYIIHGAYGIVPVWLKAQNQQSYKSPAFFGDESTREVCGLRLPEHRHCRPDRRGTLNQGQPPPRGRNRQGSRFFSRFDRVWHHLIHEPLHTVHVCIVWYSLWVLETTIISQFVDCNEVCLVQYLWLTESLPAIQDSAGKAGLLQWAAEGAQLCDARDGSNLIGLCQTGRFHPQCLAILIGKTWRNHGVWGTPFSDTRRMVVSWVASNMLCFDDGRTSLSEFWMFVAQVERTNMKGELTNLLRYCPRQYFFLHGSLRLDIKQLFRILP